MCGNPCATSLLPHAWRTSACPRLPCSTSRISPRFRQWRKVTEAPKALGRAHNVLTQPIWPGWNRLARAKRRGAPSRPQKAARPSLPSATSLTICWRLPGTTGGGASSAVRDSTVAPTAECCSYSPAVQSACAPPVAPPPRTSAGIVPKRLAQRSDASGTRFASGYGTFASSTGVSRTPPSCGNYTLSLFGPAPPGRSPAADARSSPVMHGVFLVFGLATKGVTTAQDRGGLCTPRSCGTLWL